jgi:spoIIIJ-associated protein
MAARDRRIIHLALQNQPGVRTTSEGNGDLRQVVIFPAESK